MPGKRKDYDGDHSILEVGFCLTDPRFLALTPTQKWIFIGLWLLSVKERREVLPDHYWPVAPAKMQVASTFLQHSPNIIAALLQVDARTVPTALTKMQELRLISITPDERIRINGVKSKHPNLKWKEDSKSGANRGQKRPQEEEEEEKEKEKVLSNLKDPKSDRSGQTKSIGNIIKGVQDK